MKEAQRSHGKASGGPAREVRRLNLVFSLLVYSYGPSPVPFFSCGYTHSDPYRRRSRDGLRRLHDRRGAVQRDAAKLAALRHCQQSLGGWCSDGGESVRSMTCVRSRSGERRRALLGRPFRSAFDADFAISCALSPTKEGNIGWCSGAHRVGNAVTLPESTGGPRSSKRFGNGEGVPESGTRGLFYGT